MASKKIDDMVQAITPVNSALYVSVAGIDRKIFGGQALGLATLGADGKVPSSQLSSVVLGQVEYQGVWNASLGTQPNASPEKGWYYIVSVAGSTNVSGITDWLVGDWVVYNGTTWNKIDNTDAVISVAGLMGVISVSALRTALYSTTELPAFVDTGTGKIDPSVIPDSFGAEGLPPGGIAGEIVIKTSGVDYEAAWGNIKQTLTVTTFVSAALITPVSYIDRLVISALAEDVTIANPSGTPVEGYEFVIRVKDDGTPRFFTWGAKYRGMGTPLPDNTTANKWMYIPVVYNATDDKWDVMLATVQE